MPTEVRHVLFKTAEVVAAMQSYYRRLGRPLSSGLIADCITEGDGIGSPVLIRLQIHADGGNGRPFEITIDSITLVAALIMHCKDNCVPLPARARKSLQRMGEHVCLVAALG